MASEFLITSLKICYKYEARKRGKAWRRPTPTGGPPPGRSQPAAQSLPTGHERGADPAEPKGRKIPGTPWSLRPLYTNLSSYAGPVKIRPIFANSLAEQPRRQPEPLTRLRLSRPARIRQSSIVYRRAPVLKLHPQRFTALPLSGAREDTLPPGPPRPGSRYCPPAVAYALLSRRRPPGIPWK